VRLEKVTEDKCEEEGSARKRKGGDDHQSTWGNADKGLKHVFDLELFGSPMPWLD